MFDITSSLLGQYIRGFNIVANKGMVELYKALHVSADTALKRIANTYANDKSCLSFKNTKITLSLTDNR